MLQESNRIELKATLNDKLEKEIVAFLNNHEGGILYIGIGDEGLPIENPDLDFMQLKIADRIKNNILPTTLGLFDIVTEYIENIPVIKIIISSGLELNKKFAGGLELLTTDGIYNYIAYLLADEKGVSIKVAKYAGTDKVDLIENEEYGYCSLLKATNYVLEKMKVENVTKSRVTSTKRIEKNLVEPVPLREALINAIVHNDFSREIPPVFEIFSDRMEFTSYGGLIRGQSIDDFFSCSSMPRNRALMRVFKDIGLVEQLGSGMSRILQFYDKNIFEISDHFIKVIFPFILPDKESIIANGDNNGGDNEIMLLLEKEPEITAKKISEKTGFSTRKISRIIKNLKEAEKITRIGSSRKGYWKVNK